MLCNYVSMPLPKELTTVTPFSKYLALSLFIILPLVFFYLGMKYQEQITPQTQQLPQYLLTTPFIPMQPTPPTMSETVITNDDNNKTIMIKSGSIVKIVLSSTYWQLDKPSTSLLQPEGDPIYAPDRSIKIPGMGAGTVTEVYKVESTGNATITALRGSCGEARPCAPDQARFSVYLTSIK